MMNPEIKKRWIAALLSGEYKQGHGLLRTPEGFCCLGVLCDLHAKETDNLWYNSIYLDATGILPGVVRNWALLDSCNPPIDGVRLADHNDGCSSEGITAKSFPEIAKLIEDNL